MTNAHEAAATNGSGAAAILAAHTGCLALGVLALLGDAFHSVATFLNLWKPTGPLSGVTDVTILVRLALWLLLSRRWTGKTVNMARINWTASIMFAVAGLLTFPPVMDLLQGK